MEWGARQSFDSDAFNDPPACLDLQRVVVMGYYKVFLVIAKQFLLAPFQVGMMREGMVHNKLTMTSGERENVVADTMFSHFLRRELYLCRDTRSRVSTDRLLSFEKRIRLGSQQKELTSRLIGIY